MPQTIFAQFPHIVIVWCGARGNQRLPWASEYRLMGTGKDVSEIHYHCLSASHTHFVLCAACDLIAHLQIICPVIG